MKYFPAILILLIFSAPQPALSEPVEFIWPPFGQFEFQKEPFLAKALKWNKLDGEYKGRLRREHLKTQGPQACSAVKKFKYQIWVSSTGKRIVVRLREGGEMSGTRKRKSFRASISLENDPYDYKIQGQRCDGKRCQITFVMTKWIRPDATYCRATFKGRMRKVLH